MKKLFSLIILFMFLLVLSPGYSVRAETIPGGPFTSTVKLQNMGSVKAETVIVEFYDASGVKKYTTPSQTIEPGDVITILLPTDGTVASGEYSAVVKSDQPLASLSTLNDSDSGAAYTGFDSGSLEWFVPGLYDNYYNYYSNVYAQNVSTSPVDITLEIFAPGNSTPVFSDTKADVQPYATVNWEQKDLTQLVNNVFYAGKITGTGDVVAIANIFGSGNVEPQLYSYNGYSDGGKSWNTPVVLNNYYGWNASLIIQNVTNSVANVSVNYSTGYSTSYSIQPLSVKSIYIPHEPLPSGRHGLFGAKITSDVDVVVMINQSNTYNRAATYNGFLVGSPKVYAPGVMKRAASIFSTSVTCQNVGNNPTRMEIEYVGQPTAGSISPYIPVGGTHIWYQPNDPLPDGFDGSAIINSLENENIACIVNRNTEDEPYFSKSWDMFFSANGINQ